jgi:hypothetical protein
MCQSIRCTLASLRHNDRVDEPMYCGLRFGNLAIGLARYVTFRLSRRAGSYRVPDLEDGVYELLSKGVYSDTRRFGSV